MGHFADFPFAGDADRSVVLGTMLTVVAREAIDGVTPAVSIDAPTAGSGKTLLSDGLSICATGRHVPRTAAPKNSDEERRSIMAVALSGPPIMLLDNLHRPFGGENYDPLVTAGEWSDRPTRGAESRSLPWRTVILVTGNNLQLTGDMARRVLPIRLVPAQERPEERTDIRDPRLLATLKQKHPAILVDLLTIIEGWKQAGRPSAQLTPWGSFEAWGDLVRNVVVWLGMPDPVAARPRVSKMGDSADAARRQLLLGLKKLSDSRGGSFMSKDVVVAANSDPDLSEALTVLLPRQNGNEEQATAIGSLLAKHRDRIFGGLALREAGTRQNTKLWAVDGEPESPPVVLVAETDSSATPEDDDIDWATFEG
jgi:hypothetical protein